MALKKEFGLYPALILRLFCIRLKCGALVSLNFGNVLKQVSILWGSTWQVRLHSVTPTVPESVSFYSTWKGKEFCYCLFMFSAPPKLSVIAYVRFYTRATNLGPSNGSENQLKRRRQGWPTLYVAWQTFIFSMLLGTCCILFSGMDMLWKFWGRVGLHCPQILSVWQNWFDF